MKKCLICNEPTSELNGLCPDCGKKWHDSISLKSAENASYLRLNDMIDQIATDYETNSGNLKVSLYSLLKKINIMECMNSVSDYLYAKSERTYHLLVNVLTSVLEHFPFPRVMLLRLSDYQNTARIVQSKSAVLQQMITDYREELTKELKKALSKKQVAQRLNRKHVRLRIELVVLVVVALSAFITALTLYISESAKLPFIFVLGVVPVLLVMVLKETRYGSLDYTMKIKPHISYQIDLMDVPDTYIQNLQSQLDRLEAVETIPVAAN
jgi:hypothetical protein